MIDARDAALWGAIDGFEPAASDIGAALSFYERALDAYLSGGVGPAHVASEGVNRTGAARAGDAIAYCAVPDIAAAIMRCTDSGGEALTEIIDLPAGIGRIAHMRDADGGRIGLHQLGPLA